MLQMTKLLEEDKEYGFTLCSDGWTDTSGRVLYNFMINTVRASFFEGTDEMGDEEKNAEHIADSFEPHIVKHEEYIIIVVTDSAAVMKAAGKIIERRHPKIKWLPCAMHQMELVMKKVSQLEFFKRTVKSVRGLVVWVKRHQIPAAIFRALSDTALYIPGDTRFGATVTCLETYITVQPTLKKMLEHNNYKAWVNRQAKDARIKAAYAESLINDREMLRSSKVLTVILSPVLHVLRLFDSGIPVIGFVYFAMASMRERAEELVSKYKLPAEVQEQVLLIMDEQWKTLHEDVYGAAYLLNPRYQHLVRQLARDPELKANLKSVLKRMLPDAASAAKALDEFYRIYVPGARGFGDELFKSAANDVTVPPHAVWEQHGDDAPTLQPTAVKLLSQWCVVSMCERNWKDHSNTHTKNRNRLGKRRAEKLVSVKANGRATKRARALPEAEYNWVGAGPRGETVDGAEDDDSDGGEVDMLTVDVGAGVFEDNQDETLDWDLTALEPEVLDQNAGSCFLGS